MDDPGAGVKLTAAVARERFRSARVARLATVGVNGAPHLVPVTFAIIETNPAETNAADTAPAEPDVAGLARTDVIVFAVDHKPKSTTALRRLDNIAANPRVAFLVDQYDDDWDQLWWSRADAVAAVIDGDTRLRAVAALRAKYPQYAVRPPTGVVVGCTVDGWSGWQARS